MSHKPFDLALVCGRFQPFHNGHEHVINTALALAGRVLVLPGSANEYGTKRNPFPVVLRAKLIREVFPDEQQVIIGGLNDLNDNPTVCHEWGIHVLATCKQYTRKKPDVFVYGNEDSNHNWFGASEELKRLARDMTEVKVSRQKYDISATQMREYLFRDDFETWAENCNPHLHKYYDELRSQLLNCKGLEENVRKHLHPHEGWTDKTVYLSQ